MEELRDYSAESNRDILFKKLPNSDILRQYLPDTARVLCFADRDAKRKYDYPFHFPWDINDEKSQRLTDLLIEEKIYGSQTRKDVISRILLTVFPFPSVLLDIINGYDNRNYNLVELASLIR